MKKLGTALLAASLAAIALGVAPVAAQQAGVVINFHFADQQGQTHTVAETFATNRPGEIERACVADVKEEPVGWIRAEVAKHPELAGMKYVGANCDLDKFGDIKPVQQGSAPRAYARAGTISPSAGNFAPKLDSDLIDGAPRIVIVRYAAPGGKIVKVALGYSQGRTLFHERNCADVVKNNIKAILKNVNSSYAQNVLIGNRYSYDIRELKFVGADCVVPPKDYDALTAMLK